MASNIITVKQIYDFWDRYSVPDPEKLGDGMLSNAGTEKLLRSCFKTDDTEPDYPFQLQKERIRDLILVMLDTNPYGKKCVDNIIKDSVANLIHKETQADEK